MSEREPIADNNLGEHITSYVGELALVEAPHLPPPFEFEGDTMRSRIVASALYDHPRYPGPRAAAVIIEAVNNDRPTVTWSLGYGEHTPMFGLQVRNKGVYGVPILLGTDRFEVRGWYDNDIDIKLKEPNMHYVRLRFFGDMANFDRSLDRMNEFLDEQTETFRRFSERYYPENQNEIYEDAVFTDVFAKQSYRPRVRKV